MKMSRQDWLKVLANVGPLILILLFLRIISYWRY